MSSGSYFTLYRKYKAKITDEERSNIEAQYAKRNKESYGDNAAKDKICSLPVVLNLNIGIKESEYDEQTKTWKDCRDYSINGLRANYLKVLKEDNSYIEELLTWDFNSRFTCLKDEWYMNGYNYDKSQYIIDVGTASFMLQACNYLLSGNWSSEFEQVLDNKWIRIFANGNDSCAYWKYLYRNNKKQLREIGNDEDSDEIECQLKQMKSVFDTFVNADVDFLYNDKVEYVLVYTVW